MIKAENKKAQAAIELAVFGAILIFILGTIVRTAVSNGYSQNKDFQAMRLALLDSWQGSKSAQGRGALANISRNYASVLFLEDRLSPDFNKYGDLDRTPYIAQGSGTFSYELLYPWQPGVDPVSNMVPIMDIYINGQHFPFTLGAFVTKTLTLPSCDPNGGGPYAYPADGGSLTQAQCLQNQCLRNAGEWSGGFINESQFQTVVPVATLDSTAAATMQNNASAIFHELYLEGYIINISGSEPNLTGNATSAVLSSNFVSWLETTFPGTGQAQADQIQSILQNNQAQYKNFYQMVISGTPDFVPGASSSAFDLQRNGLNIVPAGLQQYFAWQWKAVPATDAGSIGLDASSNQYPQLDIDGRLKPVTIYAFSLNSDGTPTVSYEDPSGGDIDSMWDSNSCHPKAELKPEAEIFTFTKDGTYLEMKEGKLYNPETDQFVRSSNKKDTIDLIQRTVQLSSDTGRFCPGNSETPLSYVANDGLTPNPVELCIYPGDSNTCFNSETNIKSTCYDENLNMIFVRSRLQDLRGHYWMTNTQGQLKVQ